MQDNDEDTTMTDTSGPMSPTPFAYYDPESSSVRTSQGTLPWDSTPSSPTLPRWGSMRNGELFRRPTPGHRTAGSGCSSLLGTPNAHPRTHTPRDVDHGIQLANQVVALLPTPHANASTGAGTQGRDGGPNLQTVAATLTD